MSNFKKMVGIVTVAAALTTLLPMGASAVQVDTTAKVEKPVPFAADQILVKAKAGKDVKAVAKKLGAGNVEDLSSLVETKLVKVPAGKAQEFVEKFNKDGDVEFAELDYIHEHFLTPNDPSYASQYHLTRIQANLAWDITTGASTPGVVAAVVDTGVDLQHPDLQGKFVPGYNFVNNTTNADDDHGHGTHVAGIIAATVNNGLNGVGISWGVKIMPLKVLTSTGSGTTSNIIKSVDFARTNGAFAVNMSLGGGSYSQAFQDAVNNAWNAGLIIVAAAGNNGNTLLQYPAAYENVISVASTTSTDGKSSFSTYGTWVDVAAPGSSIYSTANGGGMTTMSGTSMSAPVVTGLACLLKAKNPSATNVQIRDRLLSTCDPISGTGSYWQCGRVNAYKAVNGF